MEKKYQTGLIINTDTRMLGKVPIEMVDLWILINYYKTGFPECMLTTASKWGNKALQVA